MTAVLDLERIGLDWLIEEVDGITDHIDRMGPVEFCEKFRYLPRSTTSQPGYINFRDVNPFMVEPLECFSMDSPVREVNMMKGVQMTYTVSLLECILFYFMCYLKSYPTMLISADMGMVKIRIENNILPMLQQSDFGHIITSHDEGNSRKTGKNKDLIQWEGGGFMIPLGAVNEAKQRSHSILLLLKDEIDTWKDGKSGCTDKVTDSRTDAFNDERKILRGSTPENLHTSKIHKAYNRGDKRRYMVLCIGCGFPQPIDWTHKTRSQERKRSFSWELDRGTLIPESVQWHCSNCCRAHHNYEKDVLFSLDNGAHWKPTGRPVMPNIRSYHLPALYSPFMGWAECIGKFLDAYDPISEKVVDIPAYKVFYNNILGWPFAVIGDRVRFTHVSGHRRSSYKFGQIPNKYAIEWSGSPILFLTCQVDVHKSNLAVSIMGWCRDTKPFVIDYWRFEHEDCRELTSPVWAQLRELILSKKYISDDGREYSIFCTLVDSGYENDTVVTFCSEFDGWVFPILGREKPPKSSKILEFAPFTTSANTQGYMITVDHYKDRLGLALRREWVEESGKQAKYHFNAPIDITDRQLKELTVEVKREEIDDRGNKVYRWYRPGNAANELWDLLVYGNAAVEIIATTICLEIYELEEVDWTTFWDYMESKLAPVND